MPSLRQIKLRIRSVENTKKVTRAMEMISASKLKRQEGALKFSERYLLKLESLLGNVLAGGDAGIDVHEHPLLRDRPNTPKVVLCVVMSDAGLCGAYNHAVIHSAEAFLSAYVAPDVQLVILGRKGFTYFKKKGFGIPRFYVGHGGHYSDTLARGLMDTLTEAFLTGDVSGVFVAYTRREGVSRRRAVVEKLLEIPLPKQDSVQSSHRFIFEPARKEILQELIPCYVFHKIKTMLLSAFTSEHQARVIAMSEATENAKELMKNLLLQRNKIRQASITKEIIEVISSAEALQG